MPGAKRKARAKAGGRSVGYGRPSGVRSQGRKHGSLAGLFRGGRRG